ncbi:MAG: hypothetical protein WCQ54_11695 [Clostridiaceae bacterium]
MKIYKKLIGLMLLISMLFTLCSCADSKEKQVIKKFITQYYTIEDYTSIDLDNVRRGYPDDKYTQSFKDMMTPKLFKYFILDMRHESYMNYAVVKGLNIKVKNIKIDKYTENTEGTVVYNYEGTLEINKVSRNEIKEEDINGQITVIKSDDDKFLIYQFNKMNTDTIVDIIRSIN